MSKIEELFGERIKENSLHFNKIIKIENEEQLEINKVDRILTIGLALLILIVPLAVRVHFTDFVSPLVTGSDIDTGVKSDIFTYYKFITLVIGTIILSIVFLYKVFFVGYIIPKSKINILTGILVITIIVSALFAPNKTLALLGMYNRHDGTISYLCYIALFFIAANIKYSPKSLKMLTYCLVPFVIVNTSLGLFILYGIDVFKWTWINKLIFGELPEGSNVNAGSQLWSTFNNPNYISGFAGTLTALFFTLSILNKNIIEKIVMLIISLASFSMVLTSLSTSGFLAFLITVPLILIIGLFSKSKGKSLSFFLLGVLGFALILNAFAIKNPKVWDESIGFIVSKNPYVEVKQSAKELLDFDFESKVTAAKVDYKLKELPPSGYSAGSGRSYIWEKAIEMIGERPILGYGLDTFVFHFPQDDPEKNSALGTFNVITDKPHNLFIGLAYGAGVFSAIALILLILALLVKWVIDLFKRNLSKETIAIGMMIVAFLVQAMFNDSIIGFTNVIFIFIGVLTASIINNKNEIIGEK
ncbi:O-antigen ligase family protein [Bacillus sp. JJ1532]|uniref:O-antigen ligase family protein n=1 Tax=Bacillus sp. JJ1532 TaxID=3122958 RepID=UPI002FFDFA8B